MDFNFVSAATSLCSTHKTQKQNSKTFCISNKNEKDFHSNPTSSRQINLEKEQRTNKLLEIKLKEMINCIWKTKYKGNLAIRYKNINTMVIRFQKQTSIMNSML